MWQQVEQSLHSSMGLVVNRIATMLPGILAFIVAFLFFLLIGWLVAMLVRRILMAMHFDERMRGGASAIAEWSPRATPSLLVGRVVFWCFVFAGVVVGVSALGTSEHIVSGWMLGYVPRLAGAAILLLAGNVLARFVARSVLITGVNLNLSYARLLSMGVRWMILVLTGAMVLDHLALGGEIVELGFGILFGGIVFALALAVGLGSRDLVSRSLEREAARPVEVAQPEKIHHFLEGSSLSLPATGYRLLLLVFQHQGNTARIAAGSPHLNLPLAPLDHAGKFLAPLHQNDAGRSDQFIEAEGIQLALVLDPVQVQVIEHHRFLVPVHRARAFVFVDQREGGAGHFIGIGRVQRLRDALHQRRLAGAEVAAQDHKFRRRQQLRNTVPDSDRFLAAVAFELMDFQVRRLRHLGLAAEEGIPSNQTYPASSQERK